VENAVLEKWLRTARLGCEQVAASAADLERARVTRDDAIRAAYDHGATIKVIADAAGLSEMRVSQILRRKL
jgi:Sigma-70, region 4.